MTRYREGAIYILIGQQTTNVSKPKRNVIILFVRSLAFEIRAQSVRRRLRIVHIFSNIFVKICNIQALNRDKNWIYEYVIYYTHCDNYKIS